MKDRTANELAYINESVLLDGLYEFHPDFFRVLAPAEMDALRRYYLTGISELPANVLEYRRECLRADPAVKTLAETALTKIKEAMGPSPRV